MQVACSCGKMLRVPDTQAGKNARCPACNKVFKVPAVPVTAPPPPTKIPFQCPCGKKLSAPISAAGKKVLCPACNTEITIPAAPAASAPPAGTAPPGAQRKAPATRPAGKPAAPTPAPPQRNVPSAPAAAAAQRKAPVAPTPAAQKPSAPADDIFGIALEEMAAPPPAPEPAGEREPEQPAEQGEYSIGGLKCPHCKAELSAGAQFCVSCGTSLATGKKIESVQPSGTGKRKRGGPTVDQERIKKIVVVIIAIGVIAGMAYYLYPMFKRGGMFGPSAYTYKEPKKFGMPDESTLPTKRSYSK